MAVHNKLAVAIAFALTGISTIVLALRFYARHFLVGKLGSPDWIMLFALLATWCCSVVNYYQTVFMEYPADLTLEQFKSIVTKSLLTFWVYRLNYIIDLCLVKVSILLFFNYVASSHKSFHRIVRGLLVMVVGASFGMAVASICTCTPVSDAWSADVFLKGMQGIYVSECRNPNTMWFAQAGFNLVTDVIIWILPFPFILNLRSMPVKRRLELVGIFSIGIMSVVASAIRLWITIIWASSSADQRQHAGDFLIWGQVEQHAGIIAGSIPFLRPLLRKLFRTVPRRNQHSPSPVVKLLGHVTPPAALRTPIIPSPPPTFGSDSSPFKAPVSPVSPTHAMKPEQVRATV